MKQNFVLLLGGRKKGEGYDGLFKKLANNSYLKEIVVYGESKDDLYSLAMSLDFHTIMRIGELLALKWSDFEEDSFRIQRQFYLVLLDRRKMFRNQIEKIYCSQLFQNRPG